MYMYMTIEILECNFFDYILLCGILSNLQWLFGWSLTHLYEWCKWRVCLSLNCLWVFED